MGNLDKYKDRLLMLVEECIDKVFTNESLKGFLDVMSRFPLFSYKAQLLIWKQKPDATEIGGLRRWGSVKEGATPILLIKPGVEYIQGSGIPETDENGDILTDGGKCVIYKEQPKYDYFENVVSLFDIQDAVNATPREEPVVDVNEKVRKVFGVSFQNDFPPGMEDGFVDYDTGVFHIPAIYMRSEKTQNEAMIKFLVKHLAHAVNEEEYTDDGRSGDGLMHFIEAFASYAVQMNILGSSSEIKRPAMILNALTKKAVTHQDRDTIIRLASKTVYRAIQFLRNRVLSFDQTSAVNTLLDTMNKYEFQETIAKATRDMPDKDFSDEINELNLNVIHRYTGFTPAIYKKKLDNKVIYSDPPESVVYK